MARAPWTSSSHPPSPTAAWPRSSACPSKSSCSAVSPAGSRYENTTYFPTYIPSLSFLLSVCSQIDVHITPGTHASEEAGRGKMYVIRYECLKDCDVICPLLICSEQTAGRQRASGSCFGELLAAGGGQPVSEHQKPLNSNIFCSEALVFIQQTCLCVCKESNVHLK